jgi:hypothetical protein
MARMCRSRESSGTRTERQGQRGSGEFMSNECRWDHGNMCVWEEYSWRIPSCGAGLRTRPCRGSTRSGDTSDGFGRSGSAISRILIG